MSVRARTLAGCTAMAMLLSACFLFPPFWPGADPGPGSEIPVANETDADWVLSFGGDMQTAFAIGAGDSGTVFPLGLVPTEILLLDPDCAEVDRLEWDGSATGIRITDPGTLAATDEVPPDVSTGFAEYWECMDDAFGAPPEPGDALPEAGGTILLSSGGDGATYILDVATATVSPLGGATDLSMDGEHTWSPDGTQLAFSRMGGSSPESSVFVAAADGSDAQLLVENGASPRWSPDGTAIAYVSTDPFAGASVLAVVRLDGSEPLELAEEASAAAWSPDGERVAFMSSSRLDASLELPPSELRIVNADGSGLETLAEAAPFAGPPAWSPDGSRLAFMAPAEGSDPRDISLETVLAVYDLSAGETSVLATVDGAGLYEPAWSPDGETIAFTIMSAGLFASSGAIATVPAAGGELTRLLEASDAYFSTPIWSPDGQWLIVARSDDTSLSGALTALRPDGSGETVLVMGAVYATAWRSDLP